jgi:hypothetical protein
MNLATPKVEAKNELLFSKSATEIRGGFVEHLSLTYAVQHSVTKIIAIIVIDLVTPKVPDKFEFLSNKPASETSLLKISSCIARALGLT